MKLTPRNYLLSDRKKKGFMRFVTRVEESRGKYMRRIRKKAGKTGFEIEEEERTRATTTHNSRHPFSSQESWVASTVLGVSGKRHLCDL